MLWTFAAVAAARNAACSAFLNHNQQRPDVVVRPSGLQFRVLRHGSGNAHPAVDALTECRYEGRTSTNYPGGRVFDTSYGGNPAVFSPRQVIQGWTEAMQMMVEGDKYELFIPSELGYGDRGDPSAGIGGGDCLVFTLEIVHIRGARVPVAPSLSPPPPVPWWKMSDEAAREAVVSTTPPRCTDPPDAPLDCERVMEHADEVRTVLCPRIAAIQRAPCSQLGSVDALERLIGGENVTILVASANTTREVDFKSYYQQRLFTGLYMPGFVHEPRHLATLLVHFGMAHSLERHAPLRFVATNSNNGWVLCLAAAYLRRAHGAPLHGLAVNGLKTEWATNRNVRILLERLNLSWRAPTVFDAAADAALMSYHPHVRNSLTPTTFAPATTLMPVRWVGTPPPFDVCVRFGEYDRAAILEDVRMVGGACKSFSYFGRLDDDYDEVRAAVAAAEKAWCATCFSAHPHVHDTPLQVGGFVVRSSSHLRATGEDFAFVNKTPPAAPELYAAHCIEDMAGCDWHRGVV